MAGDAAHMAEPATGKGIGVSMFVIFYAIPTIVDCVEKNDFSKEALAPLQESIENKFKKDWDNLSRFQTLMYKKTYQNLAIFLFKRPWIRDFIGKRSVENMKRFIQPKGLK